MEGVIPRLAEGVSVEVERPRAHTPTVDRIWQSVTHEPSGRDACSWPSRASAEALAVLATSVGKPLDGQPAQVREVLTSLGLESDTADLAPAEAELVSGLVRDAVRTFEALERVTYGPIYGDGLQVRITPYDASVGVIDWGTVSFGPLVFDLTLAAEGASRAGRRDVRELWASYLDIGPVRRRELERLPYYEALMWARSAKYFANRRVTWQRSARRE